MTSVKELLEQLKDENPAERATAAEQLGELGNQSSGVINALVRALGDSNPAVGAYAALALADLRVADPGAKTALLQARKSEDEVLKEAAGHAFFVLFGGASPAYAEASEEQTEVTPNAKVSQGSKNPPKVKSGTDGKKRKLHESDDEN